MNEDRPDRPMGPEEQKSQPVPPERSAYSDAYYSAPREDRSGYGYNPSRYYARTQQSAHRGQISIRTMLILCLVCVIVSGAMGMGGLYLLARNGRMGLHLSEFYTEVPQIPDPVSPLALEDVSTDAPVLSGEDIYVQACGQVVSIAASAPQGGNLSGSGIVVSADGYILTNYHLIQTGVLRGWPIQVVTFSGDTYEAQVVGGESDSDLAVLKVDAPGLIPAALGDSEDLAVGQKIYAVGNPMGVLSFTMTRGIISARDRLITTDENVTANMFQFDAAVNNGNSGGPVYNIYGQVVGVATAKYTASGVEGLGFAIPSADAVAIANELITKGYVSGKAYLGLTLKTMNNAAARYFEMVPGAYVSAVEPDSAAQAAGILPGDIITAVGDVPVDSADELVAATRTYRAGDTAELTVFRQGKSITLSVTFGEAVPSPSPGV